MSVSITARLSGPLASLPAFVLQAVRPPFAPDAERILPLPQAVRVQVVRHRPPDSLRARYPLAATELAKPLNLLLRQIYDGPHGM